VIIMTSNVGASKLTQTKRVGFGEADTNTAIKKNVMDDLKKTFRPEFLNRLDEIIVFNQLTEDEIKEIAKIMLSAVSSRLGENGIEVAFNDSAIALLAKEGFDPVYGARPLRRAITSKIEDLFAEEILSGNVAKGDKVSVSAKGDKFVINQLKK
ncbi:MAG: ATP-dependent Clp protease ATP-binding subunit, partial [Clostridia bacterium]|nr:ATP-dependent Clp protease ATP-binding subunit [Clostridia bacterium]